MAGKDRAQEWIVVLDREDTVWSRASNSLIELYGASQKAMCASCEEVKKYGEESYKKSLHATAKFKRATLSYYDQVQQAKDFFDHRPRIVLLPLMAAAPLVAFGARPFSVVASLTLSTTAALFVLPEFTLGSVPPAIKKVGLYVTHKLRSLASKSESQPEKQETPEERMARLERRFKEFRSAQGAEGGEHPPAKMEKDNV
eukprot:CAMPEP_0177657170 /NCGR_PEP_ID=MMETSP0447-20121125/16025_1 /TAXON_ID=0 /ORGANISM="Stygamoeba regulata, Strain BSH-02190019" /LENGTH=199 /DNA_ID=CAMNT_0019161473 /DNA_START=31 /DNA_END=630 /DNA_ORIENTATION=+